MDLSASVSYELKINKHKKEDGNNDLNKSKQMIIKTRN